MASTADDNENAYELLGIQSAATEQEVRTAYRQRSLKVHPDRNPNNPDAARKFHELNQAYELLLDPLRRLALDAKLRVQLARKERFKSYDNKRKNLVEELEERERAFKKARMDKQKDDLQTWHETERIKEEGKRLREQKEQEWKNKIFPTQNVPPPAENEDEEEPPAMDPLDTTVRLKYPTKSHPTLITPASISSFLSRFGPTDTASIVLSLSLKNKDKDKDKDKPKPPKTGSALVPFKQIGDAFAAVCASGRKDLGMDGVKITWVKDKEPDILAWLRKMGKLGSPATGISIGTGTGTAPNAKANANANNNKEPEPRPSSSSSATTVPQHQPRSDAGATATATATPASPFSSFPSTFPDTSPPTSTSTSTSTAPAPGGIDYESLTLMRMRQAERERLEREILEQEAND